MKASPLAAVAVAFIVVIAGGCETARSTRIREKAALFATLDPFTQELIRKGLFNHGFTTELVVMSLGKPDRVAVKETDDGRIETWTYRNFLYESSGAVTVGVSNPGTRPMGTVLSSSAPGGPSLTSTKAGPGTATIAEETSLCTLFLDLRDDRVVAVRIHR